jgi:hypothetical protein
MTRIFAIAISVGLLISLSIGSVNAGVGLRATWARSSSALTMTVSGPGLTRVWDLDLAGTGVHSADRLRISATGGDVGMIYTAAQIKIVSGHEATTAQVSYYQTQGTVAPAPFADAALELTVNFHSLSALGGTMTVRLTGTGIRAALTYRGGIRLAYAPFTYRPWIWTGTGSIGKL